MRAGDAQRQSHIGLRGLFGTELAKIDLPAVAGVALVIETEVKGRGIICRVVHYRGLPGSLQFGRVERALGQERVRVHPIDGTHFLYLLDPLLDVGLDIGELIVVRFADDRVEVGLSGVNRSDDHPRGRSLISLTSILNLL